MVLLVRVTRCSRLSKSDAQRHFHYSAGLVFANALAILS